jgi:hypothetical protein
MIEITSSSPLKCGLCVPIGGFGNHVRWLALLDPVFQFVLIPSIDGGFSKITDPSRQITFHNAETKLESFRTQIYSPNRSWDNWLHMEFIYQETQQVLQIEHRWNLVDKVDKNLVCTIDPELALQSYFKLNSNLFHCTPEKFKIDTKNRINENVYNLSKRSENKIIAVDCLCQPILDKTFYNTIIEWFELSDCYDLANQVHGLWYDSHQRAKQEFVEYVNCFYKRI